MRLNQGAYREPRFVKRHRGMRSVIAIQERYETKLHQGALKWGFHNYADRMAGDSTFATNMYEQGGTDTVPPLHSTLEMRDGELAIRQGCVKGKGKDKTAAGKAKGKGTGPEGPGPAAAKGKETGKGKEGGKPRPSSPSSSAAGAWQQWSAWQTPGWSWSPSSSWGSSTWGSGWR